MTELSIQSKAHQLRDKICTEIKQQKWELVAEHSKELCDLLPLFIHLDGMLKIGWQTYFDAPIETKESIDKLNDLIDARRILWAKNKKKSEKENKKKNRKKKKR